MSIHAVNARRVLLAAATALLAASCLSALPSSAAASYDYMYCNQLVAPFSACPSNSGSGYRSDNNAIFPGTLTRSVCEKLLRADNGALEERVCANNWANGSYAYSLSSWGIPTIGFSGNNSQWTHTNQGSTYVWTSLAARGVQSDAALREAAELNAPRYRLATVPAEGVPASAKRSIGALRSADAGKVAAISRINDEVALRTTTKKLCLSASITGGEISCQDYDKAVNGDLLAAAHCGKNVPDGVVVLYGVVPDGVNAVAVRDKAGTAIASGEVSSNTFRIEMATNVARAASTLNWSAKAVSKSLDGIVGADAGC